MSNHIAVLSSQSRDQDMFVSALSFVNQARFVCTGVQYSRTGEIWILKHRTMVSFRVDFPHGRKLIVLEDKLSARFWPTPRTVVCHGWFSTLAASRAFQEMQQELIFRLHRIRLVRLIMN